MNTDIDTRIVQMQFDNKQFERGVSNTLKSLDELDNSLDNLKDTRGLSDIQKTINKLSFANAIEGTENFGRSLISLTGKLTVFKEIDAIANRIKSTIDGLSNSVGVGAIFGGWNQYAEKTGSVQTIMSATLESWEEDAKKIGFVGSQMEYVQSVLDKLMWYTDETSYSFTDMVNNIGKFTSAGVGLNDAEKAMEGIANWAAASGAGIRGASIAMYNLSQAMGLGFVGTMDWKSIQGANMATPEFKQLAVDQAVAAGLLKKSGDKYVITTGESGSSKKKNETDNAVTVNELFADKLSKKWFSADVLRETLKQYSDFNDKVRDLVADATNDIDTASEAVAKLTEGVSKSEQSISMRAFQAAQEAKTFGEAIDSVGEAVRSTWVATFEYIFGNYEESKKIWTDMANTLYDVFAEPGNFRNEILEIWRDKSGYEHLWAGIYNVGNSFMNLIDSVKATAYEIFPVLTQDAEYFGKILGRATIRFRSFTAHLLKVSRESKKITDSLKILMVPLKIMGTIMNSLYRAGQNLFNRLLKRATPAIQVLTRVTSNLGTVLNVIADWLSEHDYIYKIFNGIATVIGDVIEGTISKFENLAASVYNLIPDDLKSAFGWLGELFGKDVAEDLEDDIDETIDVVQTKGRLLKDVVMEVIRGDWGNGSERDERLLAAGLDNDKIQNAVNAIWKTVAEGGGFKDGWEAFLESLDGETANLPGTVLSETKKLTEFSNELSAVNRLNGNDIVGGGVIPEELINPKTPSLIGSLIQSLANLALNIDKVFSKIESTYNNVKSFIAKTLGPTIDILGGAIFDSIVSLVSYIGPKLYDFFGTIGTYILEKMPVITEFLTGAAISVSTFFASIPDKVTKIKDDLVGMFDTISNGTEPSVLRNIIDFFTNFRENFESFVGGSVSSAPGFIENIKSFFGTVWTNILNIIPTIDKFFGKAVVWIQDTKKTVFEKGTGVFGFIQSFIDSIFGKNNASKIQKTTEDTKSFFESIGDFFKSVGEYLGSDNFAALVLGVSTLVSTILYSRIFTNLNSMSKQITIFMQVLKGVYVPKTPMLIQIGGLLLTIGIIIGSFARLVNAINTGGIGNAAVAVGLVVGILAAIGALIFGLMLVSKKLKYDNKSGFANLMNSVLGIAAAVALLAATAGVITVTINKDNAGTFIAVIIGLIAIAGALVGLTKLTNKEFNGGTGRGLFYISAAVGLLSILSMAIFFFVKHALKSWTDFLPFILSLTLIYGACKGLAKLTKYVDKSFNGNSGVGFLWMGAALSLLTIPLIALTFVVKHSGFWDLLGAVTVLLGIISVFVLLTKLVDKSFKAKNASGFIHMSAALTLLIIPIMALMTFVKFSPTLLIASIFALIVLISALGGMMVAISKWGSNIIPIRNIIALFGLISAVMLIIPELSSLSAFMNNRIFGAGIVFMGLISVLVMAIFLLSSIEDGVPTSSIISIVTLTGALMLLMPAIALLSLVDTSRLLGTVAAISILVAVLAIVSSILGKSNMGLAIFTNLAAIAGGLILLAVAVGAMAFAIGLFEKLVLGIDHFSKAVSSSSGKRNKADMVEVIQNLGKNSGTVTKGMNRLTNSVEKFNDAASSTDVSIGDMITADTVNWDEMFSGSAEDAATALANNFNLADDETWNIASSKFTEKFGGNLDDYLSTNGFSLDGLLDGAASWLGDNLDSESFGNIADSLTTGIGDFLTPEKIQGMVDGVTEGIETIDVGDLPQKLIGGLTSGITPETVNNLGSTIGEGLAPAISGFFSKDKIQGIVDTISTVTGIDFSGMATMLSGGDNNLAELLSNEFKTALGVDTTKSWGELFTDFGVIIGDTLYDGIVHGIDAALSHAKESILNFFGSDSQTNPFDETDSKSSHDAYEKAYGDLIFETGQMPSNEEILNRMYADNPQLNAKPIYEELGLEIPQTVTKSVEQYSKVLKEITQYESDSDAFFANFTSDASENPFEEGTQWAWWYSDSLESLGETAKTQGDVLKDVFESDYNLAMDVLSSTATVGNTKLANAFATLTLTARTKSAAFVESIRSTISSKIPSISDTISSLFNGALSKLSNVFTNLGSIFSGGFSTSVSNGVTGLANKLASFVNKGTSAIYKAQESVSPTSIDMMRTAVSTVGGIITGDIPTDITIRPIMDLSNVSSGISELDSISKSRTFAVNAFTSDVGQKMAVESSNIVLGTNSGIADAIRGIRSDISDLNRTISGMQVVMDSGALVGSIVAPMDNALGYRAIRKGRGN